MSMYVDRIHAQVYQMFAAIENCDMERAEHACSVLAASASAGGFSTIADYAQSLMSRFREHLISERSVSEAVATLAHAIERVVELPSNLVVPMPAPAIGTV